MNAPDRNHLEALECENRELREALMDAAAHLIGAAAAYRKHAARHRSVGRAVPDPLFTTRAADFEVAGDRARHALRKEPAR